MCRVLEVSRSGYYAWLKRGPSKRDQANAVLLAKIEQIHEESDGTYGAPRMHAELPDQGVHASLNRVARVMKEARLRAATQDIDVVIDPGWTSTTWTRITRRSVQHGRKGIPGGNAAE